MAVASSCGMNPIQQCIARFSVIAGVLLLAACGNTPLCERTDLAVSETKINVLAAADRVSAVTVYAPTVAGKFPLIVFSHGAFATPERYATLLRSWASAGYVVAAPLHIDSEVLTPAEPPAREAVWRSRQEDIAVLATKPLRLRAAVADGTEITEGWIAAGHSYGAFVAEVAAGARSDWDDLPTASLPRAVVALSPPGPIPGFIGDNAWQGLSVPQIVLTGTADILPGFVDDWRVHARAYETAAGDDQWLWVGAGVDHYFGRLIGRLDRETEPQQAGFDNALETMHAFLATYAAEPAPACRSSLAEFDTEIAVLSRR